jgi:hypothetical protein
MPSMLKEFAGTLPYATELFGVFQPLLTWKSRLTQIRMQRDLNLAVSSLIDTMAMNPDVTRALQISPRPIGPTSKIPHVADDLLRSSISTRLQGLVDDLTRPPSADEWPALVRAAADQANQEPGGNDANLPPVFAAARASQIRRDLVVAGTLEELAGSSPELLAAMYAPAPSTWDITKHHLDLVSELGSTAQAALLSPVGVLHLYREYFFELESFLGSPVGHVWVSPGSTVELIEVHTRRTLDERTTESSLETIGQSETTTKQDDELSTAVAQQNARNTSLGVSASGGGSIGVVQASASVSSSLTTSQSTSEQTAHKQTREQSAKLSEEIRRSFKTTFRSVVETTDTSSRRYILTNPSEKLVNVELKRKMRKIGVQLQHVGTQLCWQVFVDHPGDRLGIAELVHVSQPDDLIQAEISSPDAPAPLKQAKTTYVVKGVSSGASAPTTVDPPAAGYTLVGGNWPLKADEQYVEDNYGALSISVEVIDPVKAVFRLDIITPGTAYGEVMLELTWDPPDQTAATEEWLKALKTSVEQQRQQHAAYIGAIRERIKLASNLATREANGLRTEERSVVFRSLVRELTRDEGGVTHLGSELLRSIFDIEAMLYFVAPDWWKPRKPVRERFTPSARQSLTDDDKVTWTGDAARANDYLVTEEAMPAPTGASLGWILQLDGDEHRNAFLNAPWVKAVIPIRVGKEREALAWLKREFVEGSDELTAELEAQLLAFADSIATEATAPIAATETVFESGFDPLAGGFRDPANPAPGTPFAVFDQWIEILPTDQIVALEYQPPLKA